MHDDGCAAGSGGAHSYGFGNLAKNVGWGLLKDASKAALKQSFAELPEREAWTGFFQKDWYARSLRPRFAMASAFYWEGFDGLQKLLEEQGAFVEQGIDPGSGLRVLVQKPFSRGSTLRITLMGEGRPGDLAVALGGARAAPRGGFVYELGAGKTEADRSGAIAVAIQ